MTFLFFLPGGDDFLDFLRPLNLPAALVAVLGLEKNLTLTVLAEEPLLLLKLLGHGDLRNPLWLVRRITGGHMLLYVA